MKAALAAYDRLTAWLIRAGGVALPTLARIGFGQCIPGPAGPYVLPLHGQHGPGNNFVGQIPNLGEGIGYVRPGCFVLT